MRNKTTIVCSEHHGKCLGDVSALQGVPGYWYGSIALEGENPHRIKYKHIDMGVYLCDGG